MDYLFEMDNMANNEIKCVKNCLSKNLFDVVTNSINIKKGG